MTAVSKTDPCGRRKQLLDAAERLFLHYGHAKTTVADIAREAGVAVGSVYLEFSAKEAIVGALSACRYASVLGALGEVVHGHDGCAARLRRFFAVRMQAFVAVARAGEHACELISHPCAAVSAAQAQFVQDQRTLLESLLRAGQQSGELAVQAPDLQARTLLRLYASFAPPWSFEKIPSDIDELLESTHQVVLHGMLAR